MIPLVDVACFLAQHGVDSTILNVPIIHYSVEWWSTLHQGPTIAQLDAPSITMDMLVPLLTMIAGFTLCFAWLILKRVQAEILDRESRARWVEQLVTEAAA